MNLTIKKSEYSWKICDFLANFLTYENHKKSSNDPEIYDYLDVLKKPSYTFVASIDDIIYGVACLDKEGYYFYLRYFAVNANYRRKKVGTQLLNYIKKNIQCLGICVTPDKINKAGLAFYKSIGFVKDETSDGENPSYILII